MAATAPDTPLARAKHAVETANRAAGSAERVRIGLLTPLTETGYVIAGEMMTRGTCLAADYVREHGGLPGGKQFEIVLEDDQATTAHEPMVRSAVAGMAKLGVVDEVIAVLGQWHVRTVDKVVELSDALGIAHFVTTGHNGITARNYRTVFRTFFSTTDRAAIMVRFMAEQGARRVAVIAANSLFGKHFADDVERIASAPPYELEVLRIDYEQETTTEVSAELARIKAWQPDFLINLGVMIPKRMTAEDIINQAARLGLLPDVPMLVGIPFPSVSSTFWQNVGAAGNLIVWPASQFRLTWPGLTDLGRWFIERYTAQYGAFPSEMAMTAFTNVTMVAQALQRARTQDRAGLVDALAAGPLDSWAGPVSFGRRDGQLHHSPATIQLLQYQQVGQKFEEAAVVYPPELQTHEYAAPQTAAR